MTILTSLGRWRPWIGVVALGAVSACVGEPRDDTGTTTATVADTVVLETTVGRVVIALENERAPITVENFLLHVRSGFYDGLVFHRVEPDFVIQIGEMDVNGNKRVSPVFPIENEAANGLPNRRGTVAMARTDDPHSATSQFFFNLVDNTAKLDFTERTARGWGYAVFGRVVEGMDAIDSIAGIPTRMRSRLYRHFPVEPAAVVRATIATER